MGLSVHYRGQIRKLSLIETFEDRVLDLALEMSGNARIWRSSEGEHSKRVVKGVLLNLAPGLETVSLLLSPEGYFIPLVTIEDAERKPLKEAPWVSVKTQFGPLDAHVALIELFDALKMDFFPNLEVNDESGFWVTRDIRDLQRKKAQLDAIIEAVARQLREDRPGPEVIEDPKALAKRVEQLALNVHKIIKRPPEHPPVTISDHPTDIRKDGTLEEWEALHRDNVRRQERMARTIEERLQAGDEAEDAIEAALDDEGLSSRSPMRELSGEMPIIEIEREDDEEPVEDDDEEGEEWKRAGQPEKPKPSARKRITRPKQHPVLERASKMTMKVMRLSHRAADQNHPALSTLIQGVMDLSGGLAQAYGVNDADEESDDDEDVPYGLILVQLKRAQRGVAFSLGALVQLAAEKILPKRTLVALEKELEFFEARILKDFKKFKREMES
jgi:hypothetical protein